MTLGNLTFAFCLYFKDDADAAMMVKELKPGVLDGGKWVYHQSPVFEINEQEAWRFDESLERLEKKYQPSQEEFYIHSHSVIF